MLICSLPVKSRKGLMYSSATDAGLVHDITDTDCKLKKKEEKRLRSQLHFHDFQHQFLTYYMGGTEFKSES